MRIPLRRSIRFTLAWIAALTASASALAGQAAQQIALPGSPFAVVPNLDASTLFVSISNQTSGQTNGIAIVGNGSGTASLERVLPTGGRPFGLALSANGRYLIGAVQAAGQTGKTGLQIIDTAKAVASNVGAILATVPLPSNSGPIEVAWSRNNQFIFVTKERGAAVTVINFQKALFTRGGTASIIGDIPVGQAPVGLDLSPDGQYLYVTSQIATAKAAGYNASVCLASNGVSRTAQGSLTVVNIPQAVLDPAHAIVSEVVAGCTPVRTSLSSDGSTAWVTARGDNALLALRLSDVLANSDGALISSTPVGPAPVGLALFDQGMYIAVANSNRFAAGQAGSVSIVKQSGALAGVGTSAVVSTFAAGSFPRQWGQSPDGQQLYLTEFSSGVLDIYAVPALLAGIH